MRPGLRGMRACYPLSLGESAMKPRLWTRCLKAMTRLSQPPRVMQRAVLPVPPRLEALEGRIMPSLTPHILKDVRPGAMSSAPFSLTAVNDTLFFSANNGVSGHELWKSNGTAPGTVIVKDINP